MGGGCPESAFLPNAILEILVDADLDTLATALQVSTDDLLKAHPNNTPAHPPVGLTPRISDDSPAHPGRVANSGRVHQRSALVNTPRACVICSRTSRTSLATTSPCIPWPTRWPG
jgi:hypothetical protein